MKIKSVQPSKKIPLVPMALYHVPHPRGKEAEKLEAKRFIEVERHVNK